MTCLRVYFITVCSSATSDKLVVLTPAVDYDDVDKNFTIKLQFEFQLFIETNLTFTFIRTIDVTDAAPRSHLTT